VKYFDLQFDSLLFSADILVGKNEPDEDEVAMLGDYGLARKEIVSNPVTGKTKEVGTEGLTAPESEAGNAVVGSDIYSFGCMFYDLVSGYRPQEPRVEKEPPSSWFSEDAFRGMRNDDPVKLFILEMTVPLGTDNEWPGNKECWTVQRPTPEQALDSFKRLVSYLDSSVNK
jgi:serine/threonine protein kinase